ncbi:MAG: hypothetical protein ACRDL5_04930, partial [Solirubrobacteraceae bacterium]
PGGERRQPRGHDRDDQLAGPRSVDRRASGDPGQLRLAPGRGARHANVGFVYQVVPGSTAGAARAAEAGSGCHQSNGTMYIDPSGAVFTRGHVSVSGAKVTLLRSTKRSGRFTAPRSGSAIMSPGNRRNPDRTNALGLFGWDVVPGYYRVTASKSGCTADSVGRRKQEPERGDLAAPSAGAL